MALSLLSLALSFVGWPLTKALWPSVYVSALCPLDPSNLEGARWESGSGLIVEESSVGDFEWSEGGSEVLEIDGGTLLVTYPGRREPLFETYFYALEDPSESPHSLYDLLGGGHERDPPGQGAFSLVGLPYRRAVDPWDQPWRFRRVPARLREQGEQSTQGWTGELGLGRAWEVYSSGPNGLDEGGRGDDIQVCWSPQGEKILLLEGLSLWPLATVWLWLFLALRAARAPRGDFLPRELWAAGLLASPAWAATAGACYWQRERLSELVPAGLSALPPVASCTLTLGAIWFGLALFLRTRRPAASSIQDPSDSSLPTPGREGLLLIALLLGGAALDCGQRHVAQRWKLERDLAAAAAGSLPAGYRLREFPAYLAEVADSPEGPPPLLDFSCLSYGPTQFEGATPSGRDKDTLALWNLSDSPRRALARGLGFLPWDNRPGSAILRRWTETLRRHPYRFRGSILSNPRLLCALSTPAQARALVAQLLIDPSPSHIGLKAGSEAAPSLALRVCDVAAFRFARLLLRPGECPRPPKFGPSDSLSYLGGLRVLKTPSAEFRSAWDAYVSQVRIALKETKWSPAWLLLQPALNTVGFETEFRVGAVSCVWPSSSVGVMSDEVWNWIPLGPLEPGTQELRAEGQGCSGASVEDFAPGATLRLTLRRKGSALVIGPLVSEPTSPPAELSPIRVSFDF